MKQQRMIHSKDKDFYIHNERKGKIENNWSGIEVMLQLKAWI